MIDHDGSEKRKVSHFFIYASNLFEKLAHYKTTLKKLFFVLQDAKNFITNGCPIYIKPIYVLPTSDCLILKFVLFHRYFKIFDEGGSFFPYICVLCNLGL